MSSPRGIRNRNPGNIEDGAFARACNGYAGVEPEGRFARFAEMKYGLAAIIRLLKVYRAKHGLTTVRGIINRWAPPTENVTSAYVLAVCDGVVQPDEELPDTKESYHFVARGIVRHENGKTAADEAIRAEDWDEALKIAGFLSVAPKEQVRQVVEPAPEAPKETKMPAPFVGLALSALIDAVPSLIRAFGKGQRSEENAKLADVVVPIAKAAVGATNEQDLVEKLSDAANVAKIDRAIAAQWFEITEAGGGGVEGARKANIEAAGVPLWKQPAFIVTVLLLPLVYYTVHVVLTSVAGFSGELKAAIASSVVTGVLGGVLGFWLGSSFTTSKSRGLGSSSTDGVK